MIKENNYPMHVVLFATGKMYSLWLPKEHEGIFNFNDNDIDEPVPISINAYENKWYANIIGEGYFFQNNSNVGNKIELTDCSQMVIITSNDIMTLYSENERENDNAFLPYCIEDNATVSIGRTLENDIFYSNQFVSRKHAQIYWNKDKSYVEDLDSTNGIYLNGISVKKAQIKIGDVIYMVGMRIIIAAGYIAINNVNDRITINTQKIKLLTTSFNNDLFLKEKDTENSIFDRKPRRVFFINDKEIEIEMPPMSMGGDGTPIWLKTASPLLMGGRALATGNIFMAMTSMVLPVLTQGLTEKERKSYEKLRIEKYNEYLNYITNEIDEEIDNERQQLIKAYPDLSKTLDFALKKNRLWERRKFDEDFLNLRIGKGQIPMIAKKKIPAKKFEIEKDPLVEKMYDIADKPALIEDAPIMLSLCDDYLVSIMGSYSKAIQLIKNLIIQLSITHSYDEVKIVLLCKSSDEKYFDFAKYLPHIWNDDNSFRMFATEKSEAMQISRFLNTELAEIFDNKNSNNKKDLLNQKTSYVVFALDKELYDTIGIFKCIKFNGDYSLLSVITAFNECPKETSKIISLDTENSIIDLKDPLKSVQLFSFDNADETKISKSMMEVMKTKLRIDVDNQFALPNMITFLELFGAGRVEHLNPLKRWQENNPIKSLATQIGIGTDGRPFTLDLHEKHQGPHGLIAGGTGSGKSEFIITYILSMAVNFSPDEVAFVLIDYKGGGLADAFVDEKRGVHLPHVVGTITNLDGAAIQRSLISINSEIKRRQTVFKKAKSIVNEGTMDIYDYQRLYRNKEVDEPMPHLMIISDEFAELKKQEPEFMDELISIARIGRSLGVHLILATQKPSGIVDNQIWSNTKFRVCLKVADKNDSYEMLKRDEAAEIKNTGRFYLQVGYNDYFEMGQSAWCGAEYYPQDEVIVEEDKSIQFVDNVGQVMLNAKPQSKKSSVLSKGKQIVSIVKCLSDLSKRENYLPRKLWCEPLKKIIDYDELEQTVTYNNDSMTALVGMIDDPLKQAQYPLFIDMDSFHHLLICGASSSGKSTLLKTLVYSLISRYSPDEINYYILDLSGGALNCLSKATHCGAYLTENNETDFDRLLGIIEDIVEERKKIFIEAEVSNFENYCQNHKLPLILFIFDGYTNINNFKKGPSYYSSMGDILKKCSAYGIRFIISCNHVNEVHSRTRQEIDYRIAIQAKDRYEYSDILDFTLKITTPKTAGRGMLVIDKEPYEVQFAIVNSMLSEQERNRKMRDQIESFNNINDVQGKVKYLSITDENESYENFCKFFKNDRIPLGYTIDKMNPVAMPLHQMHCMSVYFGNPNGVYPFFRNIIYSAELNKMDIIIIKSSDESVFEKPSITELFDSKEKITFFESNENGLTSLKNILMEEIQKRNVFRDKYCSKNDIPLTKKNRAIKAKKYIRSKTKPLLIIFESLGEICRLERTKTIVEYERDFSSVFEKSEGYNIYFVSGFYPQDSSISKSPFIDSFNNSQFSLLFGGRYDKQCIVDSMPLEIRTMSKINPNYNRFILKYRGEFYQMRMPFGELKEEIEPDDASII